MKIVFWSGTGNTEKMASVIADGIVKGGKEAELINVSEASNEVFDNEDVVILGCPAMGDEILEESEFEPFVESIAAKIKGKKVALFGSYGWGDGQWMRDWVDRMNAAGAKVVNGEGLICQETPDDGAIAECESLGKQLAAV